MSSLDKLAKCYRLALKSHQEQEQSNQLMQHWLKFLKHISCPQILPQNSINDIMLQNHALKMFRHSYQLNFFLHVLIHDTQSFPFFSSMYDVFQWPWEWEHKGRMKPNLNKQPTSLDDQPYNAMQTNTDSKTDSNYYSNHQTIYLHLYTMS